MKLLLSNKKQVENSVNKYWMETWGNQQSAVQTGGKPYRRRGYTGWHYPFTLVGRFQPTGFFRRVGKDVTVTVTVQHGPCIALP
jgi:hypothetical protein